MNSRTFLAFNFEVLIKLIKPLETTNKYGMSLYKIQIDLR